MLNVDPDSYRERYAENLNRKMIVEAIRMISNSTTQNLFLRMLNYPFISIKSQNQKPELNGSSFSSFSLKQSSEEFSFLAGVYFR